MIDPASTVAPPSDPSVARGVLCENTDGKIVLSFAGTDYRLHLVTKGGVNAPVGSKVEGRIVAQARRIDVIKSGGRYVEPVEGRPRRVQGRVIGIDESAECVIVSAGVPICCKTNGRQKATDFKADQMVTMDVLPGAFFKPED